MLSTKETIDSLLEDVAFVLYGTTYEVLDMRRSDRVIAEVSKQLNLGLVAQ
jgi:hypothetical protein